MLLVVGVVFGDVVGVVVLVVVVVVVVVGGRVCWWWLLLLGGGCWLLCVGLSLLLFGWMDTG